MIWASLVDQTLYYYLYFWSALLDQFLYYSLLVFSISPVFILIRLILGLLYESMFLLHFLLFLGYPVVPIFIIGLLYWSNFITPDVHNLGYSSSHVLLLTYFIFWSSILDQYFISLFIFLGLYTGPIFIF